MHYGLDVGVRRIAVACPELPLAAELRLSDPTKRRPADARAELHALVAFLLATVPGDAHIWVEAPFVGRPAGTGGGNKRTAIRLGMTVGALIAGHAGPSTQVDQSTWKASVVGHGNASKDDVRDWLAAHHPALSALCGASQDLRDASCIALHGAAVAPVLGVCG